MDTIDIPGVGKVHIASCECINLQEQNENMLRYLIAIRDFQHDDKCLCECKDFVDKSWLTIKEIAESAIRQCKKEP